MTLSQRFKLKETMRSIIALIRNPSSFTFREMPILSALFSLIVAFFSIQSALAQPLARPFYIPPRLVVKLAPPMIYWNQNRSARFLDPHPDHEIIQILTDKNKIKSVLTAVYSGQKNHWIRSILTGRGEWFEVLHHSGSQIGQPKKISQPLALGQTVGQLEPLYYYLQKLGPEIAEHALSPKNSSVVLDFILKKTVELEQLQANAFAPSTLRVLEFSRELCEKRMSRND